MGKHRHESSSEGSERPHKKHKHDDKENRPEKKKHHHDNPVVTPKTVGFEIVLPAELLRTAFDTLAHVGSDSEVIFAVDGIRTLTRDSKATSGMMLAVDPKAYTLSSFKGRDAFAFLINYSELNRWLKTTVYPFLRIVFKEATPGQLALANITMGDKDQREYTLKATEVPVQEMGIPEVALKMQVTVPLASKRHDSLVLDEAENLSCFEADVDFLIDTNVLVMKTAGRQRVLFATAKTDPADPLVCLGSDCEFTMDTTYLKVCQQFAKFAGLRKMEMRVGEGEADPVLFVAELPERIRMTYIVAPKVPGQ